MFLVNPTPLPITQPFVKHRAAPVSTSFRRGLLIALAIAAISAAVRVPGLFTDAWIDEIWSRLIASQCTRFSDILFSDAGRIDNNHPLITLWMWLLGSSAPMILLRFPSLLAGVGTSLLAWRIARRESGVAAAIFATIIVTFAFPLVFYSSEARGYALAVFFAFLSYDALQSSICGRTRWIILFNFAAIAGMLSHLTFLPFLAALIFGGIIPVRRGRTVRSALQLGLSLVVLPVAAAFILNHFFISRLVIGGAAPTDPLWTIIQSTSLTLGGPMNGPPAMISAAVVLTLIILAQVNRIRDGRMDRALFDLLALLVMPGFLLAYNLVLSQRPQPLMPRYFLLPMAFAAFPIAESLAMLIRHRASRVVVIALSFFFIAANAIHYDSLCSNGRGRSVAALKRMSILSNARSITVGSDNEFPVGSLIEFDRVAHPSLQRLRFISNAVAPDFWISTNPSRPAPAGYELNSTYPAGELSGTSWWVYRRAN